MFTSILNETLKSLEKESELSDFYYDDFILSDIQEAHNSLIYSDHECNIINNKIKEIDRNKIMYEILRLSSKSSTIKIILHCDIFIAKGNWLDEEKKWKFIKQNID